jgi:hypothetical protein
MRLHIPAHVVSHEVVSGLRVFVASRFRIFVAGALLGCLPPAYAGAQSLADVARKEEDRRKGVKDGSKVFTNRDLGSVPPATVPPPADASTPAAATPTEQGAQNAQSAPKPEEKQPAKDQAYWSGRKKELQSQLDRDQTYLDALQSRVNTLASDFVNRDDPAQRSVIERDRQKALGELERLKVAVESARKALTDLEEEARRAGVPPGWLR